MHSVLEGVVKRFFKLWFEEKVDKSLNIENNYSLKHFVEEIDTRLLNIKIPSFIPVCPRSILEFHTWRANEFLAFVLFYMLPVFNGLMKPIFYTNITKFVVALEYLLNREMKRQNLEVVKQIFKLFVKEVEEIYPENIMLSGMHELLHLVDCTKRFGPLNLVNCFQFEELNRKIGNLIFGKDLIGDEFPLNFSILQALNNFCNNFTSSSKLKDFIDKHKVIKTSNKKRKNINSGLILGPLSKLDANQLKLASDVGVNDLFNFKSCVRITYNGVLYTHQLNSSKRGDFCIQVDGDYGLIEFFLVNEKAVSIVVRKVSKLSSPFFVPEYPTIQSKLFLCFLTDEYFLTTFDKIMKAMYITIEEDLCFISTYSMSHLFL